MAQCHPSSQAFSQFIRPSSSLSYTSKTDCILKYLWASIEAMKRERLNAMPALSKFLVLLALFLLGSHVPAFTSLSLVARDQVRVNHLIWSQQPLSKPTNELSREPICEPTKRLGQDALLHGNLSSKRVLFQSSMMDDEIQSCKTHSEYTQS